MTFTRFNWTSSTGSPVSRSASCACFLPLFSHLPAHSASLLPPSFFNQPLASTSENAEWHGSDSENDSSDSESDSGSDDDKSDDDDDDDGTAPAEPDTIMEDVQIEELKLSDADQAILDAAKAQAEVNLPVRGSKKRES
jgi:hypothetical protein